MYLSPEITEFLHYEKKKKKNIKIPTLRERIQTTEQENTGEKKKKKKMGKTPGETLL